MSAAFNGVVITRAEIEKMQVMLGAMMLELEHWRAKATPATDAFPDGSLDIMVVEDPTKFVNLRKAYEALSNPTGRVVVPLTPEQYQKLAAEVRCLGGIIRRDEWGEPFKARMVNYPDVTAVISRFFLMVKS